MVAPRRCSIKLIYVCSPLYLCFIHPSPLLHASLDNRCSSYHSCCNVFFSVCGWLSCVSGASVCCPAWPQRESLAKRYGSRERLAESLASPFPPCVQSMKAISSKHSQIVFPLPVSLFSGRCCIALSLPVFVSTCSTADENNGGGAEGEMWVVERADSKPRRGISSCRARDLSNLPPRSIIHGLKARDSKSEYLRAFLWAEAAVQHTKLIKHPLILFPLPI